MDPSLRKAGGQFQLVYPNHVGLHHLSFWPLWHLTPAGSLSLASRLTTLAKVANCRLSTNVAKVGGLLPLDSKLARTPADQQQGPSMGEAVQGQFSTQILRRLAVMKATHTWLLGLTPRVAAT